MDISVLVEKQYSKEIDDQWLRSVLEYVLDQENVLSSAEVSLMVTSQEKIRDLNRVYREIDEPTDVLSFGMLPASASESELPFVTAPDGFLHLGEIVISYPQASIQAAENGTSVKKEILTLIIHGTLHLLGYDHENTGDQEKMQQRERQIVNGWKEEQP